MKILMTADTVGGVWTYALDLCRELSSQGAEVALATMGRAPSGEQEREAREIPGLDLFPSEFKLEWMSDPWREVDEAGEWLLDLDRRIDPEVVHLNGYAHGALPFSAPVVMVAHSCVCSWWRQVQRQEAPPEWDGYRRRVTRGLHAADLVAAPTRAMLGWIDSFYGPLGRSRVIPNGRPRRLYAAADKEPLVLAAGRLWDEAKNLSTLARVARRLEWPVVIAGDPRHPEGGEMELPGVSLLGQLPPAELAGWLGRASIYALPARYEPFGLSVLEAALAGCALVLGNIPTLRELWEGAAWFVDPDDEEELHRAVNVVAHCDSLRDSLALRAHRRALGLTPQRMAKGYLAAYREVTRRRRSSPPRASRGREIRRDDPMPLSGQRAHQAPGASRLQ